MICHSCFASTRSLYCAKCQKELFDGVNIKGLSFDKIEFEEVRREVSDRMSLSGIQNKISLALNESAVLEPTATKGAYILKPCPSSSELSHAENVAANEHLSMYLSEYVFGIKTAKSALIPFSDGELAYLTKRFDYTVDGRKLPQEDFASLLTFSKSTKGNNYKFEGSYELIAQKMREVISVPIAEIEEFYKRVLFNYLIGNADAHVKNYSIMLDKRRRILTPNYDLLYTGHHVNETFGELALDLFIDEGERQTDAFSALGRYSAEDFKLFAKRIGIPQKRLKRLYDFMSSKSPEVEEAISKSFLSDNGKEAYLAKYEERLELGLLYDL
jgi:serine/threonine-protein kinase HipA